MFKRELKKRGFQFKVSETPIIPIHVGDAARAFEFSKKLFEAGVFAPAVGYPIVAEGKARLRAIVSAAHKREQLLRRRTFCPKLRSHWHRLGQLIWFGEQSSPCKSFAVPAIFPWCWHTLPLPN